MCLFGQMFFRRKQVFFVTGVCVCVFAGVIAAAVFIGFLLALYAVLWKCMVRDQKGMN